MFEIVFTAETDAIRNDNVVRETTTFHIWDGSRKNCEMLFEDMRETMNEMVSFGNIYNARDLRIQEKQPAF